MKIWGIQCRLAANAVVLVLIEYHISIATYLFVEYFRVRSLTSPGSTGGRSGDAKTIISPNTLFGDKRPKAPDMWAKCRICGQTKHNTQFRNLGDEINTQGIAYR